MIAKAFSIVAILETFFTPCRVTNMSSQGEHRLELLANDLLDLENLSV